ATPAAVVCTLSLHAALPICLVTAFSSSPSEWITGGTSSSLPVELIPLKAGRLSEIRRATTVNSHARSGFRCIRLLIHCAFTRHSSAVNKVTLRSSVLGKTRQRGQQLRFR